MSNETALPVSNFQLLVRVIKRQDELFKKWPILVVLLSAYVVFNVTEPYFYKLFIDVVEAVLSGKISSSESVSIFVKYALLWGAFTVASILSSFAYLYQIWGIGNLGWAAASKRLLRAFFLMPYDYHVSVDVGEKVRISERGPNAEFFLIEKLFLKIVPDALIFL